MGFQRFIRQAIHKFDFFYTAEVLRVKAQPDYKTLLGGFTSIAIIIALITTFSNKIIGTLDKIIITSSIQSQHFDDPKNFQLSTYDEGKFMFGVEVWYHDLNIGNRYFDVVLKHTYYINGNPQPDHNKTKIINLQPCTRQHWSGFPQVIQKYDRMRMHQWQCLPKNSTYEIYGKYSSKQSMTLDVAVMQCTNSSDNPRPCATPEEIDALFQENGNFYYTIYFLNALINPASHQYLTFYLEDSNYIMFDRNGGQEAQLWVQDFTITTDQSIFPFADQMIVQGGIVTESAIKNRYNTLNGLYGTFFFFKSPKSQTINRSFEKIDEVFAYIGGLFGSISMALFMISIYNQYAFEIMIAGYLFDNKDKNGNKIYKDYNFFYFVAQLIYAILRKFKFKPNWPKVKQFFLCSQEMVKQLDILYLIRRVTFLERSIGLLIEDHHLKGLHLMKQLTLNDAKRIRMKYKMRSKLKKEIKQKTIKDNNNMQFQGNVGSMNKIQIQDQNRNELNQSKLNKRSIYPQRQLKNIDLKMKNKQEIKDQECYSSDEELSEDQGLQFNQLSVLEAISLLEEEKGKHSLSNRIWKNMEQTIKQVSSQYIKNNQNNNNNIYINNQNLLDEETISQNNFKNSQQLSQIKFFNSSSKLDNNLQQRTQAFQKPRNLPKIDRRNVGKIVVRQVERRKRLKGFNLQNKNEQQCESDRQK